MTATIAERRKALGMTQAQLAKAIGVTVDTVRNWEQGRRLPRSSTTIDMALRVVAEDRARALETEGPGALLQWSPKELASFRRGNAWPVFYREMATGAWISHAAVAGLPAGSFYWATEAEGIWYKMQAMGPKFGRINTGIRGPFPPYRPWDANAKESL